MGLESCESLVKEPQDLSLKSSEKPGEIGVGIMTNEAKVEASLGPMTPDANKEIGDFPLDLSSPLTTVKKLAERVLSFSSRMNGEEEQLDSVENCDRPRTPADGVFDSSDPSPADMVLTPLCKKFFDQARVNVARRLNFSSSFKESGDRSRSCDEESLSDEEVLKSVYENLLEVIVSKQAEGFLAETSGTEWDSDVCKTPPSAPQLSRVAETCPGAPMKPMGKSQVIDLGLCRKLEF